MAKKTKIKEEGGDILDATKPMYCTIHTSDGEDIQVGVESSDNGAKAFAEKLQSGKWIVVIDQSGKNKQIHLNTSLVTKFFFYQ